MHLKTYQRINMICPYVCRSVMSLSQVILANRSIDSLRSYRSILGNKDIRHKSVTIRHLDLQTDGHTYKLIYT